MTVLKKPTEQTLLPAPVTRRRRWGWPAAALLLAIAVLALGAWVIYGIATEAGLPGDVDAVIDDYIAAWEAQDEAALRALVTDEYRFVSHEFELGIGSQAGEVILRSRSSNTIEGVVVGALRSEWEIERLGEPIVSGQDPWVVSLEEKWTNCSQRDTTTGECGALVDYVGLSTVVIVDEAGVLKIADHVWSGLIEM